MANCAKGYSGKQGIVSSERLGNNTREWVTKGGPTNIKSLAAYRPPEMFRPVAPRAVNRAGGSTGDRTGGPTGDSTGGRAVDRTGEVANTRYANLVGFDRTGERKYRIR